MTLSPGGRDRRAGRQGDGVVGTGGRSICIIPTTARRALAVADGQDGVCSAPIPRGPCPVCPHFGSCGGCVSQHIPMTSMSPGNAASSRGLPPSRHRCAVSELLRVPAASRRRVTVHAKRYGNSVRLGFQRAATHEPSTSQRARSPYRRSSTPSRPCARCSSPCFPPGQRPPSRVLATRRASTSESCSPMPVAWSAIPAWLPGRPRHGIARLTLEGEDASSNGSPCSRSPTPRCTPRPAYSCRPWPRRKPDDPSRHGCSRQGARTSPTSSAA